PRVARCGPATRPRTAAGLTPHRPRTTAGMVAQQRAQLATRGVRRGFRPCRRLCPRLCSTFCPRLCPRLCGGPTELALRLHRTRTGVNPRALSAVPDDGGHTDTRSDTMADPATSLWWQTANPIPTDSRSPASCGVLVAGAGLSGIATALLLARRGVDVTVVDARGVGAVTTGNTTGKLSLLQGSTLGAIREEAGDQALRAYVVANQQAQEWVLHEAGADETIAERQRAVTFATTPDGDRLIAREREALDAAGLPFADTAPTELPFPITTAIAMHGQW